MLPRGIRFSFLVLLLLIPQFLRAQPDQWQSLAQLQSGQKVTVIDHQRHKQSGELLRFSDVDLTLTVKGQQVTVSRDDVYRVTATGTHRKRNALIGLLAGAAAGGAVAAGTMERESGFAGAVAGSVAGFAGIGAAIGALMPGSRTVYQAHERKQARANAPSAGSPPVRAK